MASDLNETYRLLPSNASGTMPPEAAGDPGPVCILLATYNGARHLPAQLASFCAQSHGDWSLRVSDDGSVDDTRALIAGFAKANPDRRVVLGTGPGRGAGANFLSLLVQAVAEEPQAAIAFSDQDDVWLPDKLARATAWLVASGARNGAALAWTCRTVLTDAELVLRGESRRFARPPGFGNALVQNILAGNTIVLSPAAAQALAQSVPAALAAGVPYHDWWIYQMMTGIGAGIHIDPEPLVLYRQHRDNHLGHHGPVRGRLQRFDTIRQRRYSVWLDANLAALRSCQPMLTPAARLTLRAFMRARRRPGLALAATLSRLGLYRQTARGDQALRLMALTGRL